MSSAQRLERYRKIANKYRKVPGDHGLRQYRVYAISSAYPNGLHNTGYTDKVEITESGSTPPKVHFLTEEERALGGYESLTVEIGPITPKHEGGGTDIATLKHGDSGGTFHYEIVGPQFPNGARFAQVKFFSDRQLRYMITASRVAGSGV